MSYQFCGNPWVNLGVYRSTQYACCAAAVPSLAQPARHSSEILDDNFYHNGVLWNIWNSKLTQELRKVMSEQGIGRACNIANSQCGGAADVYYFSPHTDIQQKNIDLMNQNMINRKIVVDHHPVHLELSLDHLCNMQCPHCFQKVNPAPQNYLPITAFRDELCEFLRRACTVCVFGGEPTVCKDYDTFIALAREASGARIDTITNGHFIIQKILPDIDLFHNISVSIDAVDEDVYNKIRKSSDEHYNWDRLMFNITKMNQKKTKLRTFTTTFLFVINGFNYHQIPDMILFSKNNNADKVVITEIAELPYKMSAEQLDKVTWIFRNPQILSNYVDQGLEVAHKQKMYTDYHFKSVGKCGSVIC